MAIKKFLKDNKGCPLTVPAIKQLLVKFIELMSKKGVVKEEVSDIKALTKETLDELQVGDIIQKITGKQKHAYMVTYKGEGAGEGICLTYCAAGYMETVSYDRAGEGWTYNSTDVVNVSEELDGKQDKLVSGTNIKTVGGESLLGSGNIPLLSSGTKLYKHYIEFQSDDVIVITSTKSDAYTSLLNLTCNTLGFTIGYVFSSACGMGIFMEFTGEGNLLYFDYSEMSEITIETSDLGAFTDTVTPL